MTDVPEEKIILDRKSFEALAVDSRIRILKSLKQRRKTLSELSDELGLSVSGVKEHLENLEEAGLIRKIDDGHKWKYYELTKKGAEIVGPKELRVWILLSISLVTLISSMMAIYLATVPMPEAALQGEDRMPMTEMAGGAANESYRYDSAEIAPALTAAAPPTDGAEPAEKSMARQNISAPLAFDMNLPVAIAAISGLVVIGCAWMLIRNRARAPKL